MAPRSSSDSSPVTSVSVPVSFGMTRAERDRFEAVHGLARPRVNGEYTSARATSPGAPPRHDWDAFWIEVCQHINDRGRHATQVEMVRRMLDWFAENSATIPDESTVKKKVSRFCGSSRQRRWS